MEPTTDLSSYFFKNKSSLAQSDRMCIDKSAIDQSAVDGSAFLLLFEWESTISVTPLPPGMAHSRKPATQVMRRYLHKCFTCYRMYGSVDIALLAGPNHAASIIILISACAPTCLRALVVCGYMCRQTCRAELPDGRSHVCFAVMLLMGKD